MYKIIGIYMNCSPEELDTAETKAEALNLLREYRIAYGKDWIIKIKR